MNLFRLDLPLSPGRPRPAVLAAGFTLGVLALAYCAVLWPEWRQNPDLSHGFFSPVIFALLVWESRRLGPLRWIRPGRVARTAQAVLAVVAVGAFGFAGLFAASVGWSHSLVLFLLGACLAALLLAGLAVFADERVRVLPFNWINLTAILLWVLVAPLPSGTYARLTLALQESVTTNVMNVLQFFGVPARQHGNVIELARTTVGIADACSGVRSLISCVYAGFFFAAWQVRRPGRRLVLILSAPLLALGMNFLRSLTLTLLANRGVDIGGNWHDATGYAILGLTAVILAALALWLETKDESPAPAAPTATVPPAPWPFAAFWAGTVLVFALAAFFFASSRSSQGKPEAVPALAEILPASAPGWEVQTPQDLFEFSGILQTTHLLQRSYLRADGARGVTELTVYIAYWPPGQTSVSRVASHTPDACWPGSGWAAQPALSLHRTVPPLEGRALAPAEYRFFRNERNYPQHVWFWHVFDGRAIDYQDPYSIPALLEIALKYGFRRQGSQYFIRISSNRPWTELAAEPLLRQILANLQPAGI
jgi:exosortase